MKTFYFPSMKNIIFQVINKMLTTKFQHLTFHQDVIANLIEQLNLFGMSVEKFKRIMKLLITEFIRTSSETHVAIHEVLNNLDKKTGADQMKQTEIEGQEGKHLLQLGEFQTEKMGSSFRDLERSIYHRYKK